MKYMGSKARIAGDILPYIHNLILLNNIDTYIEPFVGGANMIDKVICSNRIAYDKNRYLIALFNHLKNGGELPEEVSREQYEDCKQHYKAKDKYYEDWYLGAVGFLASYNGKFYDGGFARTTIEDGKERDYYQESKKNLLNQMPSLMDVTFKVSDYKKLEKPHGCLVYMDPPYAGTTGYNTITKHFNHQEFWDLVRDWSKDNIVLVSEESAPDDFDILWEGEVLRSLKADEKKYITEKLYIHSSINDKQEDYDF